MAHVSDLEDLALHGVRVMGFPTSARVAARYRLDVTAVEEALLDVEALGWARLQSFGGSSGWSLTEAGRAENERRLTVELDRTGARDVVAAAHTAFVPLNRRFGQACTAWQVRPLPGDPIAFNDHTDHRWDEQVLQTLTSLDRSFRRVTEQLTEVLARFDGYADRYSAALAKVDAGQRSWVDAHDRDSLHMLWIQFHEDLLATLGIPRGSDT